MAATKIERGLAPITKVTLVMTPEEAEFLAVLLWSTIVGNGHGKRKYGERLAEALTDVPRTYQFTDRVSCDNFEEYSS